MSILSNAELSRLEQEYPELKRGCPTCHGNKYHLWKGERHECLCTQQIRLQSRYCNAGIGMNYQRLTWEDLTIPAKELAPVQDWLDNAEAYIDSGMGLFITGPLGTGKTLVLMLVLKELVKRKYDCYATTFAQTVESFTATWGDNEEKRRFAQRFMRSEILGLDDLGKEYATKLSPTTFDYILRTRVQNARPTIFTTNLSAPQVKTGYGAAVLSLLVEKSIEVPLTGADFRPQAHERSIAEVHAGEVRPIV